MSRSARLRGTAASAAVVIAAMAVGRLVSDHLDAGLVDDPFVRHAEVGERVPLDFVDLTVDRVLLADSLVSRGGGYLARDVFVVVDLTARGVDQPQIVQGLELVDADGRRYKPTTRAACGVNVRADPGVDQYLRLCFDAPTGRVKGMELRVARVDGATGGAFQRRDEVAMVDLGLDARTTERLLAEDLTLATTNDPFTIPDPEPKPAPMPAEEES